MGSKGTTNVLDLANTPIVALSVQVPSMASEMRWKPTALSIKGLDPGSIKSLIAKLSKEEGVSLARNSTKRPQDMIIQVLEHMKVCQDGPCQEPKLEEQKEVAKTMR